MRICMPVLGPEASESREGSAAILELLSTEVIWKRGTSGYNLIYPKLLLMQKVKGWNPRGAKRRHPDGYGIVRKLLDPRWRYCLRYSIRSATSRLCNFANYIMHTLNRGMGTVAGSELIRSARHRLLR